MKKIVGILIASLLVCLCASTVMADTTITVSGTGETLVPADTAIISLGVNARDRDVLNAQARVNDVIAQIRAALLESGVEKEDINTDIINIYAMYDYREDTEELTAYNANSTLAIRTEDMERVGEIIDIAFGAGANTLNGVYFSATNTQEAEKEALALAVADAKEKAQALAEAADLQIRGIVSINEGNTYSYDRGVENNFSLKVEAAGDTASTVVQAAKLTVSTNISITYTVTESAGDVQ